MGLFHLLGRRRQMSAILDKLQQKTFLYRLLFSCALLPLFCCLLLLRLCSATSGYAYQAALLQEANVEFYWYPERQEQVVIVVDPKLCHDDIRSWQDFYNSHAVLGLNTDYADCAYSCLAFTQGIGGDSLDDTLILLNKLWNDNRLMVVDNQTEYIPGSSYSTKDIFPVEFMFKSRALAKQSSGRSLTIIEPREGSLTLTYGLITQTPLPNLTSAEPNTTFTDPVATNAYIHNFIASVRRNVHEVRQWTTADGYEHLVSYLILLVLIVLVFGYIYRRTTRPRLQRALLALEAIMLLFSLIRIVKLEASIEDVYLVRYLWYAFYPCFFGLSLACLLVAYYTGSSLEEKRTPTWWKQLCYLDAFCLIIVLTNDLHGLFAQISSLNLPGDSSFSYGVLNLPIKLLAAGQFVAVLIILLKNNVRSKFATWKLFLPSSILVLELFYHLCYTLNWLGARNTETTFLTNIGILFFLLAAGYAGILPSNKGYHTAFYYSGLSMQIQDQHGGIIYDSASKLPIDTNTRLHLNTLESGKLVWQEDITAINRVNHELSLNKEALKRYNSLLQYQKKIQGHMLELKLQDSLFRELEKIIAAKRAKIKILVTKLQTQDLTVPEREFTVRLLSCLAVFIKKRSILFLSSQNNNLLATNELLAAFQDSCTYYQKASLNTACSFDKLSTHLPSLEAMLIYDAAELVWENCSATRDEAILLNISERNKHLQLNVRGGLELEQALQAVITLLQSKSFFKNYIFTLTPIDESITLTMQYQESEVSSW